MNTKASQLWSLVWVLVMLAYGVYLLMYLQNSKKYMSQMSQKDQDFRKIALVVTIIQIVSSGLIALGLVIALLAGDNTSYAPSVTSPLPPGTMGWY